MYEWEARGASLAGYVAGREWMRAEACNCRSPEHRDYHGWLVENPGEYYSDAVVVEISPRLLEAHPLWSTCFSGRKSKATACDQRLDDLGP